MALHIIVENLSSPTGSREDLLSFKRYPSQGHGVQVTGNHSRKGYRASPQIGHDIDGQRR